jgi:short-subunit dehydrogenase
MPHLLPYTASKFALTGLTEGLRPELARDHIYVTGVYPSTMRTGGHTHAWFKGDREGEYTWFALSDTLPVLSASADHVARRLWQGVCDGEAEVVVGWPAHLAAVVQNLFPNEMAEMMAVVNRLLPRPSESDIQDAHAVQGEKLAGALPDMLNRFIPSATRPGFGNGRSH